MDNYRKTLVNPAAGRLFLLMFLLSVPLAECSYELSLSTESPVAVLGANIQLYGELRDNGKLPSSSEQFRYTWRDNAIPSHRHEVVANQPSTNWTVNYPAAEYSPGRYIVELTVERWVYIYYYVVTSRRLEIQLTSMLNGELGLRQNGTQRNDTYVSSRQPLQETIEMLSADFAFIRQNASYIRTYWFVDCHYVGISDQLTSVGNYTVENSKYIVQVLVYASLEPLPPPVTTTTSTTTTTTSTLPPLTTTSVAPTTTSTTTTTTDMSTSASAHKRKREANAADAPSPTSISPPATTAAMRTTTDYSQPVPEVNAITLLMPEVSVQQLIHAQLNRTAIVDVHHPLGHLDDPLGCMNKSAIAMDKKHVYGMFYREIIVQNPIENLTITGANWLQYGDVLHMGVRCQGSPPFSYCIAFVNETYTMNGNETCAVWVPMDTCEFRIDHYDLSHKSYKLLVLVRNRVTQLNREVMVNVYEAAKQSQLSVIVVPVACCLVAVCLVVFGVAYYMQNRSRFAVEVADFNFAETASVDMEYKTFRQRLYDGVRELVVRRSPDATDTASESSLKYGSMT